MNPLPSPDPSVAVAYRRCSSAEQGRAYGPAAQAADIGRFGEREGLTIAADIFEDRPGTLPMDERPGLREALAAAFQHGAGTLIVARHDRLARDEYAAHDALRQFRAAGVQVRYADGSNGEGEGALFTDAIMHAVAADERRRIVARLKAGRAAKAAAHPRSRAHGGRVPLGYRRTLTGLEIDPRGAAEVRRVFALIRDGKGVRGAAERMSAETGRRWHPTTVAAVVRRDIYRRAEPGRIVDPRVFNAAAKALADARPTALSPQRG